MRERICSPVVLKCMFCRHIVLSQSEWHAQVRTDVS